MSKEIMRVTLSAKQVCEACEQYAHRFAPGDGYSGELSYSAGYQGDAIEVVVSKRRVRKAKAAAA